MTVLSAALSLNALSVQVHAGPGCGAVHTDVCRFPVHAGEPSLAGVPQAPGEGVAGPLPHTPAGRRQCRAHPHREGLRGTRQVETE